MENKKKVICFGEVLWDVVEDKKLIGGAPLNVCYHLSKCNIDSRVISQVGSDTAGTELLTGIKNLGVNTALVTVSDSHPTSKVLVHVSDNGKVSYDIVEGVAWDFINYDEQTAREIALSDCFVYGSLITRNSVSKNTLLKYLECSGWNVLDLNLRTPYYTKDIIQQLLSFCHTLKINDEELLTIADMFFESGNSIEKIFTGFPNIQEVIVTKGAEGVSYYSKEETIDIPGIRVDVVDTVGSGDSFLAAYLAGRLKNKSVGDSLRDAVALSAFIASRQGACPVYDMEEVKCLTRKNNNDIKLKIN